MKNYKLEKLAENIYYLDATFDNYNQRKYTLNCNKDVFILQYGESEKIIHHNINLEDAVVDIFQRMELNGPFKLNDSVGFIIRIIK
jgi:hypothetical protein